MTLDELKKRLETLQPELDKCAQQYNVLVGHINECKYQMQLLEDPVSMEGEVLCTAS